MNPQKVIAFFIIVLALSSCRTNPSGVDLKSEIEKIISTSTADIGVSIIESSTKDLIEINGDKLYPMLSTVKVPIALAILSKVEKGELSMKQEIFISKEELLENTWSPFREEFPEGNIAISLEDALNWMVINSDNNMTDILFRLIGGPEKVEEFMNSKDFIIKNNEADMHEDWEAQFVNRASPNGFSQLLKKFSEEKIVSKEWTDWMYESMTKSLTGVNRLKGKLPDVTIAQRAGTSFTSDEGVTGVINNVGIIELPNKDKIFITVFIHNTSDGFEKGEEMIADIAKATYDYYVKKQEIR